MNDETESTDFALGAFVSITTHLEKFLRRFKIVMALMAISLIGTFELISVSSQNSNWLFVSRTTAFTISLLVLVALVILLWAAAGANESTRLLSRLTESVSFMMLPPRGKDPASRIRNQILETSEFYARLVEKKPEIVQTNVRLRGRNEEEHDFSLFLHNPSSRWWRLVDAGYSGDDVFVKRIEQETPADKDQIIDVKRSVQDCLRTRGTFPVPSRVFVVSPTGFTQDAVRYATSPRGKISRRHHLATYSCRVQLIHEKADGWFEVLNF